MKHKTVITPLNCAFSTGLNTILRMEESEYIADTVRSIYCKSPDISWFKMKSVSATPYLEPTVYGVKPGDIIEVEFEALAVSGDVKLNVPLIAISSSYATSTLSNNYSPNPLKEYYKKFKYRLSIPSTFTGIGVLLNIRPIHVNSEIIIKNLEVTVDTSNPLFSVADNIAAFRTKADYLQCIDYLSGTNVVPTYNGMLTVYKAGEIIFPDENTMKCSGVDLANFKGLMSCFNGQKYRMPIAVYAEYSTDGTNNIIATINTVDENGALASLAPIGFPPTSTLKKKIIYINGSPNKSRKTFVDLGRVGGNNFSLKNVRFSVPQFDDSVKRVPNKLEELYTNLNTKLR